MNENTKIERKITHFGMTCIPLIEKKLRRGIRAVKSDSWWALQGAPSLGRLHNATHFSSLRILYMILLIVGN